MEEIVLLPHRWRRFSPWFTLAQGWGQIVEAGLPPNSHSLPHGYFGDIKHLTKEPVKDTSLSDHTIRPPKGRELNNGTRTRRLLLTPFPWEQKPSQHLWGYVYCWLMVSRRTGRSRWWCFFVLFLGKISHFVVLAILELPI